MEVRSLGFYPRLLEGHRKENSLKKPILSQQVVGCLSGGSIVFWAQGEKSINLYFIMVPLRKKY